MLFTFFTKSYFNEEVNCTEPYPSVSIPWNTYLKSDLKIIVVSFVNTTPAAYIFDKFWTVLGKKSKFS